MARRTAGRVTELGLHRGHVAVARLVPCHTLASWADLLVQRHPAEQVSDAFGRRPQRITPGIRVSRRHRRATRRGPGSSPWPGGSSMINSVDITTASSRRQVATSR